MKKIRANVRYDEHNNRYFYRDFEIWNKVPEIGDTISGEDVIDVSEAHLDFSQGRSEVFDYDYFRVETTCNGENDEDENIVIWIAVEKEEELEDENNIELLATRIRDSQEWNPDDLEELCAAAGLSDEWEKADGKNFEDVVNRAADILGVEIY